MTPDLSKIPQELKDRPQWVCFRPDKAPVNPRTGQGAKANDPTTWADFQSTVRYFEAHKDNGIAGIGYEFSPGDPFTGIDLDHCRDKDTGQLKYCVQMLIDYLSSYSEISPSETGVHIIIRGTVPPGGNSKGLPCGGGAKVEMYSEGRYFTVTGQHLEGTPSTIEPRQAELEALHTEIFGKPQAPPKGAGPALELSDRELLDKAHHAHNGEKFSKLWRGDMAGYDSPSEATAALLNHLCFWCGPDPARIDRLFRQSGLMRPKWDRPQSGSTWGNQEIHKAIARATEFYNPGQRPQARPGETPAPPPKLLGANKPEKSPAIRFMTGPELQAAEFKDPEWIIKDILPEGLCLLSARPKKGKTWLGLGVSVGVSAPGGGCVLGRAELRITPGKVLYLCLEDKLRRAQRRLQIILGDAPFPEDLILAESWPRLDKGGLEALQDFLKEHSDCKLVVVDSFSKIKPIRPKNADPYDFEMAVGGALQTLAQEHRICLLIIYHTRKAEAEDPIDEVIGSTGLTGAVDAILILRRGRGQADGTLFVTGRDVEEQELALKFHPQEGLWELMGTAAECAISQERKDILLILEEVGPKTPGQLSKIIGNKSTGAIRMTLMRMKNSGEIRVNERGEYFSIR